jgi:hypothetical protein
VHRIASTAPADKAIAALTGVDWSSEAWLLRKQAEAVDEVTRLYVPSGMARTSLEEYANRLRQQADQMESTHD